MKIQIRGTLRSFVAALLLLTCASSFDATAAVPKIKHIVIVVQENRTVDNLFHGLKHSLPGADIADSGLESAGTRIPLTPVRLNNTYDLDHSHSAFTTMYNNGLLNGANKITCSPNANYTCPPYPQYGFVDHIQVQPYLDIAINYGFANRMFQSNQGPSFPAHQFIISGTSAPSRTSLQFAAENPWVGGYPAGCVAGPGNYVQMIRPGGDELTMRSPCFDHATLIDLLDSPPGQNRAPLSWRYYAPNSISIWTAPNAIYHLCEPSGRPARCTAPPWTNGEIVLNPKQVLSDIAGQKLAEVSWVIPSGAYSDHAGENDGEGPSWVASIVNAVGESSYWQDTAILITWDDWGGWYDHVPPPIEPPYGYYEDGFRVPLLVVSAYTHAGYISDRKHDFGSILKFVETVFDLGLIPPGTFADARADDLLDFFDFSMPPRSFVPIAAPLDAAYFLNDTRQPTDPDND
jgi:phospholipase C